jgi:uncharacterized repeat protein (TIGR01451 family)
MLKRMFLALSTGIIVAASLGVSCAVAASSGPGWLVSSIAEPTNFYPGQTDRYLVRVTNIGTAASTGTLTISDSLPAGVTGGPVRSEFGAVAPGQTVTIPVGVLVGSQLTEGQTIPGNGVTVSGGGAPSVSVLGAPTPVVSTPAAFGIDDFEFRADDAAGGLDTLAGDHPESLSTNIHFDSRINGVHLTATEEVKDVIVELPLGFVGDELAAPRCPEDELDVSEPGATDCPANTRIGLVAIEGSGGYAENAKGGVTGLYDLVPEHGYPAEFGFTYLSKPVILYAHVVPTPAGYAIRVTDDGIPRIEVGAADFTWFGDPEVRDGFPLESNTFFTDPADCSGGPLTATAYADSWEHPGALLPEGAPDLSDPDWRSATTTVYPSVTGCERLSFHPGLEVRPTTTQADEPSGLSVILHVPQADQASGELATPPLKNVSVTLPAGLSLDPSSGDGLQACSDEQIAFDSALPGDCPDASVLGTVKIKTPLLETPLEGQVFLGSPNCDPCSNADAADGNMYRIFLQAEGSGVVIKKEGTVYANTSTGQLTSVFDNNPQLPFSELEVQFKGGLRAPLATPQTCGSYATTSDFTPWSTPITPDADPTSEFGIGWSGEGAACPSVAPFNPYFEAGTSNPNAAQFSPFTLTFGREDREQDLSQIQVRMPPGLSGILTGIPLCGEPQAALGTCSLTSRIGTMTVAAGPGGHPFYEQGSIYLTGPYGGAPFGLSIVVPTVAGPFNLGNVVVRSKISIDPSTTALTVTSDPFPQILDGIPLRLRTANVTIERPGFVFNPSNCDQMAITATITSAQGAVSNVSYPFAVAGCRGLKFDPTFKVSTSGRTSRVDGASLDAKVIYPTGAQGVYANIKSVKVDLPKQLPSRLTTLQKACPAATFQANPAACPSASVIGIAKATTPLLPVTLMGPVYFVSHGGEAFPDLEIVLQGYGVRVDLVGSTFISKAGITSSTFKTVPDAPVSSFELYFPQGKDSALAATGDLCTSKLVMPTAFTGQNGAEIHENTQIAVTGCPKMKTAPTTVEAHKARTAKQAAPSKRRS